MRKHIDGSRLVHCSFALRFGIKRTENFLKMQVKPSLTWKLKASKLDLFLCLSFSIFNASYTGKVCMVLLQIHSQLSDQTVHLLWKCNNDKIMKIPFRVFQTIFLDCHVLLYISTVGLSCIHSSKEIIHSTRLLQGLKWDQAVYFLEKKFIKAMYYRGSWLVKL